jgi:hypothetical protein
MYAMLLTLLLVGQPRPQFVPTPQFIPTPHFAPAPKPAPVGHWESRCIGGVCQRVWVSEKKTAVVLRLPASMKAVSPAYKTGALSRPVYQPERRRLFRRWQ